MFAASLKSTFFRALDHKLPKLDDLRQLLSTLFHRIDTLLTPDNLTTILRTPITPATYQIWQQTVTIINKLERKELKKKKRVRAVFHTLFLQMALQLFNDVKLATDSLEELFKCYERIGEKRKEVEGVVVGGGGDDNEDPDWIEVITDLFLNWLSQNLHLLRSVIGCVFPYLCGFLSGSAMHQILSVLDPKSEVNPLVDYEEDDEESSEESSEEESEEDDENETINDKLRMAVSEALGANGYQTDEESINIDDIDEEQGQKLDAALAHAFKQFKPNLGKKSTKKQTKEDETLTHFRVRTLDLIEIYLDAAPSMLPCLEIMITLLSLLEFCVRDPHQKPLQDRVRACLKKLTTIKKFTTTDDVTETVLEDLMKSLLEKGTKNGLIIQEMADKIAESCVFIIRCAQHMRSVETTPKKVRKRLKKVFIDVLCETLERFFKNRDCLTPFALFHNVLQTNWEGSVSLAEKLVEFAFSDEVRLFRRSQALDLLKTFYTNHRFLLAHKIEFDETCSNIHTKITEKTLNLLTGTDSLKINEKYISHLLNLLLAIKNNPLQTNQINWTIIGEKLQEYRLKNTFSKEGKTAYKKLCASLNLQPLTPSSNAVLNKITPQHINQPQPIPKKVNDGAKKLKKQAKLQRMELSSVGLNGVVFTKSDLVEEQQDSGTGSLDDEHDAVVGGVKRKKLARGDGDGNLKKRIKV